MSDEKKTVVEEDDEPSAPAWMATFSDMMTLLMTFFILIMSFSTMELDKFKMAMGSLKGALGVLGVQKKLSPNQSWFSPNTQNKDQLRQKSILDHIEKMRKMIEKNELEDKVNVTMGEGEIIVELKDNMLFDSGSAVLKPNYFKLLSVISQMLFSEATEIRVEGHTDDIPIRTQKYPSNWELSVDRALSVVRYFVKKEGIPPDMLVVAGLGEFRPIVPNDSPKNRAKNRRVIINVKF